MGFEAIPKVIVVAQAEHGETEVHATDAATETHAGTEAAGGEHGGAFPPFDPTHFASQLLWLALTFGALYLLMSRMALPRIGEIIEVRRDRIESDLAEADRMRQRTDQAIAAYEAELAEARKKAHGIAEDTRAKLKAETDAIRQKVEAELSKKMAAAEASIQETKRAALANVDEIAADTAQAIVAQISGKATAKQAKDAVAKVVKGQG